MRYSQAEKMEVIRLVENSRLSVKQTLNELDISRSTFYDWYRRYSEDGYDGLADRKPCPKKFWNRIPDVIRQQVVDIALDNTDKSPRELAWHITDTQGYFISESSVYRILKSFDLITSPNYIVLSASNKFRNPTRGVHELWQTDFTYFKIIGWGWYYLAAILDDFSRFIITWKLFTTMAAEDVQELLDMAIAITGVDKVKVKHRPRLLSDNGPCYISKDLEDDMDKRKMDHTRGRPYHPMTQGKIERFHRSMKNVVNLNHYYLPGDLENEISQFIDFYNNERYHESIDNVTPADMYLGRHREIVDRREKIKRETLKIRRKENLKSSKIIQYPQLSKIAESHIN